MGIEHDPFQFQTAIIARLEDNTCQTKFKCIQHSPKLGWVVRLLQFLYGLLWKTSALIYTFFALGISVLDIWHNFVTWVLLLHNLAIFRRTDERGDWHHNSICFFVITCCKKFILVYIDLFVFTYIQFWEIGIRIFDSLSARNCVVFHQKRVY